MNLTTKNNAEETDNQKSEHESGLIEKLVSLFCGGRK